MFLRIVFCLFFLTATSQVQALGLPTDTDNDGVADTLELWLAAQGISDDNGGTIDPGAANTYNDNDQNDIPDLIQTQMNLVADGIDRNCSGAVTARRGLRIYSGTFNGRNFLQQYLTAYTICHNPNQTVDNLWLYSPLWGVGTGTATATNVAGVYDVTLTWPNVSLSGSVDTNTNPPMTGTITINGSQRNFRSGFMSNVGINVSQVSGIYGAQIKHIAASGPLAQVISSPLNPSSDAGQIVVPNAAFPDVVLYDSDAEPVAGYYESKSGALFFAAVRGTETIVLRGIVTMPTVNESGGRIRGEVETQEGGITEIVNFYAAARAPQLAFFTEIDSVGNRNLLLQYFNLPLSADSVQISLEGTPILTVNAANADAYFRQRNLVPAFLANPDIGISTNNQRVTAITFNTTNTNGNYSVSVSGNQPTPLPVLSGSYTDSNGTIAVVSNVQLNGSAWTADLTGIRPDQDQTINHGGAANADRYTFSLARDDNGVMNGSDANRLLFRVNAANTSFTIPNGVLEANTKYCGRIRARLMNQASVRSRTDRLCFTTTVAGGNTGGGNTGNTGGGGGGGSMGSLLVLLLILFGFRLITVKREV